MGNVVPTKATGTREQRLIETAFRQDALTARVDRIATHLNAIAQAQNNAAESNQELQRTVHQLQRDLGDEESDREIERELAAHQYRREQNSSDQEFIKDVYRTPAFLDL